MDRVAIKNRAKEMIRGNKWYLWKPYVIVSLIVFAISFVIGFIGELIGALAPFAGLASIIIAVFEGVFNVWYSKYVLDFTRGNKKEFNFNDVIEFCKKHWLVCFLVSLLVGLNIMIGSILFVVPGIIAAFGLLLYTFVAAEEPTLGTMEILKKSWAITNGHKMDLFVLMLSFIGWEILAGFTLGILYIWLVPYVLVTVALVYESLKGTAK